MTRATDGEAPKAHRTLMYSIRKAYGRTFLDPECGNAHLLLELTGRKVLRERDLAIAKQLGFDVRLISTEED